MSTTAWDGWSGSPLASSGAVLSHGTKGLEATPALGMTISRVLFGENLMAALKDETRSSHFVTSVLWYWALWFEY
jgi:hypothetical protein